MRGTRRSRTGDGAANPIHIEQAGPRTKGSELLELVRTILCDEGRSLLTDRGSSLRLSAVMRTLRSPIVLTEEEVRTAVRFAGVEDRVVDLRSQL